MIHDIEEEILQLVNYADYQKGLQYDEDNIYPYDVFVDKQGKHFEFMVCSERTSNNYEVLILLKNQTFQLHCTCPQYAKTHSCKHLAACLICYSEEIFKLENKQTIEQKSKQLLQELKNTLTPKKTTGRKKALNIECEVKFEGSYYSQFVTPIIKIKIGEKRMYQLNMKLKEFLRAYSNEELFYFGKDFTYNPEEHFLTKEQIDLLNFFKDTSDRNYYSREMTLDQRGWELFLKYQDNQITIEGNKEKTPVQEGLFFQAKLEHQNDKYLLDFQCDFDQVFLICSNYDYILFRNNVYHLNAKEKYLVEELQKEDISKMIIDDTSFSDFKECLLPIVRNQVELGNEVSDLIIPNDPTVKYYFDLDNDGITGKIIFDYDGYEVLYGTSNKDEKILRNKEFEEEKFNILTTHGFTYENNQIILNDLDNMVDFLEDGLDVLSKDYAVYTSEKMKQTQIFHKPSINSSFHLGMDDILHYHLTLEGVGEDELKAVYQNMKAKKKYFRLKSGDVLDLENKELQSLKETSEELDMDFTTDGKIPKYRALYLNSLGKTSDVFTFDTNFQNFIKQFQAYKDQTISFTDDENKLLRDYQKEGVSWLTTIFNCGFGGILADEMGLGKSLQTIVFLRKILTKNDKVLIVCPTSLVYNWDNEFHKFAKEMKWQVFAGNKKERKENLEAFQGNIYITSYGLLKEDIEFYEEQSFKVCIIDEAQAIKNPLAEVTKNIKKINAKGKFALTGTPIENSVVELWSIFDFIMPGFMASLTSFQQKYKIRGEFDEDTNKLLSKLKNQIKPFLLRRKKSDVAKDLPAKIENNIYVDFDENQKKVYAAAVYDANKKMEEAMLQGGFQKNKMVILSLLTRLRQICIDPHIVLENYTGESAKIEELLRVTKEVIDNGHKILLFTSFRTALDLVKQRFDELGITNYTIAGNVSSKKRAELVDAFNKDDTNVFLIMLKSGGTGLNLTSADVVIHLDLWWNPQAENQATDRTHRIGQTHAVEVIKLICKNTIEEKILTLQTQKKELSDKLIENGTDEASFIKNMTEDDIRNLLSYENADLD